MISMAITCAVTMIITFLFIFNQAEHSPILLLSLFCAIDFHASDDNANKRIHSRNKKNGCSACVARSFAGRGERLEPPAFYVLTPRVLKYFVVVDA